ncbi:PH domain-containing protein [Agromyces endophyticus]|uniref:PH domain-containing protein n=1 Tax=Agromyces sp. H17E-10 TaxID=2932244 RepID=UPI001FD550C9|nr:PH domain-containing protein [Agromyces sp. H17E-10]UOQ88180.1 PH domain-containing protein [Agromyces sp. H17E-10]
MPEPEGAPVEAPEPAAPAVPDVPAGVEAAPAGTHVPAPAAAPALDAAHVPDVEWRRVSPKYIVVEVVGSLIGMVVFVGALVVVHLLWQPWWALWAAGAVALVSLIGIALEPRRVRSIGYRLREDDLLFRRGIMFQRQVAVPYGRMQLIDITRGPVARALGLAELKFVTAAASTAVTVPGIPMEEADRLRDELVALAETRRAGL